jgi:DNA-binding MarR family transcriptional regulator
VSTTATPEAVSEALMPAIGVLRRLLRRVAGPAFGGGDPVSPAQREVLLVAGRRPGCAVAEIARELGLAPNSVSTMVTHLVATGHLVRVTDPQDRRIGRLSLTPGAAAEAATRRARRRGLLLDALDRLTPGQVADLAAGIDALGALAAELQALERQEVGA